MLAYAMPAPRRQALQERVAAAILEGAARTLAVNGPEASMSDVAVAAGVARATVYRYFPNRQALLDELAVGAVGEAATRLGAARLDEVPAEEGVTRAVRALIDVGDPFVVMARERMRPAEFEQVAIPLSRLFERARANGDVRDDVPVEWLIEALMSLIVSILASTASRGREDTVAAISSLFLDGARRRRPRPA